MFEEMRVIQEELRDVSSRNYMKISSLKVRNHVRLRHKELVRYY